MKYEKLVRVFNSLVGVFVFAVIAFRVYKANTRGDWSQDTPGFFLCFTFLGLSQFASALPVDKPTPNARLAISLILNLGLIISAILWGLSMHN